MISTITIITIVVVSLSPLSTLLDTELLSDNLSVLCYEFDNKYFFISM